MADMFRPTPVLYRSGKIKHGRSVVIAECVSVPQPMVATSTWYRTVHDALTITALLLRREICAPETRGRESGVIFTVYRKDCSEWRRFSIVVQVSNRDIETVVGLTKSWPKIVAKSQKASLFRCTGQGLKVGGNFHLFSTRRYCYKYSYIESTRVQNIAGV